MSYGTMFALAVVASLFVTLSLASPSIVGRQTSACMTSNQSNFTLLAIYKSSLGIRLSLALDTDPTSGSFGWIGSTYTMTSVLSSNFDMAEGGITTTTSEGLITGVSIEAPLANGGGVLTFALAADTLLPIPAKGVYCVLDNTAGTYGDIPYLLSMGNGDSDGFSLCVRSDGSDVSVVVYNAAESSSAGAGYNFVTCTNITVGVLPPGYSASGNLPRS